MKQILVILAAMVLVGCGSTKVDSDPRVNISDRIVFEKLRAQFFKSGRTTVYLLGFTFTKADLADVNELNLMYSQITDESLKDVAKLQNLTRLYLGDTKITDAGLKEVAKLQNLTRLRLPRTKVTDAGLKEVAKLQKLERLLLTGTKVTKAGVAELKKALPNCKIEGP